MSSSTTLGSYRPSTRSITVRGTRPDACREGGARARAHPCAAGAALRPPARRRRPRGLRSIAEADAMRVEAAFMASLPPAEQAEAAAGNGARHGESWPCSPPCRGPWSSSASLRTRWARRSCEHRVHRPGQRRRGPAVPGPPHRRSNSSVRGRASRHDAEPSDVEAVAPEGAEVVHPSQPLPMLHVLVMLDAWLPWSLARGSLDTWESAAYVTYRRTPDGPLCCCRHRIVHRCAGDVRGGGHLVGRRHRLVRSTHGARSPGGVRGVRPRCGRGGAAPAANRSEFCDPHRERRGARRRADATRSAAVPHLCVVRRLIDDPSVASLLGNAQRSPDEQAAIAAATAAARAILRRLNVPQCTGVDLTELGAADLSERIHAREVSCREVMAAFLDRIDARNPAAERDRQPPRSRRAGGGGDHVRRRDRRRPVTRLDARPSAGDQGSRRDARPAHHVGFAAARRLRARLRRAGGEPDEAGRLPRDRQDQRARVRSGFAHVQRGVRAHAQPVRPRRARRVAAAAVRQWRWPRECCRWPMAATTWARCATPRPGTTCSASARARDGCRASPATRSLCRPPGHRGPDGPQRARRGDAARHAGGLRPPRGRCRLVGRAPRVRHSGRRARARSMSTPMGRASAGSAISMVISRWRAASCRSAPPGSSGWSTSAAPSSPSASRWRPTGCGMRGSCGGTSRCRQGSGPSATDPSRRSR